MAHLAHVGNASLPVLGACRMRSEDFPRMLALSRERVRRASTSSLELRALQPPWEPRKTFREWGRVCVGPGGGEFLNLKSPHNGLGNQTLGAQRDSPVELICFASWVWDPQHLGRDTETQEPTLHIGSPRNGLSETEFACCLLVWMDFWGAGQDAPVSN